MFRFLTTTVHISAAILTKSRSPLYLPPSSFSPPHFTSTYHRHLPKPHRSISIRAVDSSSDTKSDDVSSENQEDRTELKADLDSNGSLRGDGDYPSGEFEFETPGAWKSFLLKLRMLIAYPWQRVRKGSVLNLKLRGQISDQVKTRFSSGLSLPQICENLIKAAYDPRISGVYLHIETLNCGWAKIEEIRRHILDFRKSGKFIIGYAPLWGEKEYYLGCACEELYAPPSAYFSLYGLTAQVQFLGGVLEKVGVEPQVQIIGKYKSAGDQLTHKNISEENREVLNTLLDNIYGNWVDKISQARGKKKEEIESFINEGVYQIDKLKEDGWITDIKYDDEFTLSSTTKVVLVHNRPHSRFLYGYIYVEKKSGIAEEKKLPIVDYKKYSKVKKWTVGLSGGKDKIAVIRASGGISRVRGPFSSPSSGIIAEQFIEKIRSVRESKRYKAVIIRIDSPGGDALASDLMWREIRLLAESKPVVASMVDVAASGGYYMAMAVQTILSENLTLTGSIGVVIGKFNLGKLYERIGFNKEVISRGRFAELTAADQRPFRPDEEKLFAESAQNAYKQFRNKAAFSRSMSVDKMEEFAQGRVSSGNDTASRGLVDAIGGFSRAVAIAKHKANIPQDKQVTLVELSRSSPSLPEILSGIGSSVIGIDMALKELMDGLASSDGVQACMDGIMFQRSEGSSFANPIFNLLKDYLSSL